MESKKKRLDFLDVAKFIGIFLMVYAHARERGSEIMYIVSFHMPLFFVISGMTFKVREGESAGDFLVRKIKTYIIPFLILAIMITFCDMGFDGANGVTINWEYFVGKMVYIYQNTRPFPLWFVLALFFSHIWLYLMIRLSFKRDYLVAIYSLVVLGMMIVFYRFTPQRLVHSMDASLVGVFFLTTGYLFFRPWNSRVREWILSSRLKSFLVGGVLFAIAMVAVFLVDKYIDPRKMFDMWGNTYQPEYLRFPTAVVGSFGVIILSNVIANPVMGYLGRHTLVVLAFQQDVTIRWFKNYIAADWYNSITPFKDGVWSNVLFTFVCTLFSLGFLIPISIILMETHISYIFCKKPAKWYLNLIDKIKNLSHKEIA